ncbi:RNA-splicing factor [Coemansia javaensis]|uniref:RNA-splicing factor n=1 Tax=Coemansia javaensis TaxID=2761396 RepID=A0A9W8HA63_9FUNG|nr:RNA-splicing factor [Coemansia javaensis]
MYNGIGLTTPRGSGTSGHVVKSAAALRPGQGAGGPARQHRLAREHAPRAKPVDQGIVEHNRRRQVEVRCLELQDELEAQGCAAEDIEDRVARLRARLLAEVAEQRGLADSRPIRPFESQRIAEAKDRENRRMAGALRVEEGYAEGAAFDRELQDLRRQKRLLERERDRARERSRDRRRRHRSSRRSRSRSPRSSSASESDGDSRHRHRHRRRHRSSSGSSSRSQSSQIRSSSSRSRDRSRRHRRRDYSASRTPSRDRGAGRRGKERAPGPEDSHGVRAVEDGEPGEIEDLEPAREDVPAGPPGGGGGASEAAASGGGRE